MTADVPHGLLFVVSGSVLLTFGACARLVERAQARSKSLGILLAVVALCFGGFMEMWTLAGIGLTVAGIGLLFGGVGAVLVGVGLIMVIVGLLRLMFSFPARQRSARARLRSRAGRDQSAT